MLLTRAELLEKLRLGEDTFFELKEVRTAGSKIKGPTQDMLADEMAAFANSSGGGATPWCQRRARSDRYSRKVP